MTESNTILSVIWLEEQQDRFRAAIANKLGGEDSHAIDDVWQELLLAVEKNKNSDAIEIPEAWVRKVIHHKVSDYLRSKQRSERLKNHASEAMESPASQLPFDWVLEIENRQQVRDALARCTEENRTLLKLKYFSEQSVNQIASSLNTTPKAAEYRLHRAREEFRNFMTQLREKP